MSIDAAPMSRRVVLGALALLGSGATGYAGTATRSSSGRSFYVATWGDDSNPGTLDAPFRSIGHAFAGVPDLGANDSVIVMPGDYAEQVVVSRGGDATGFLTLRSHVRHGARIRSPKDTYSAVNIVSSYVVFEGFDVRAGGDGHGIEATFLDGKPANNGPHHLRILDNVSHDNAGSGIGLAYGDFYTLEGNVCHGNCATNGYQGSGISIYAARAVVGPAAPFRNFVRRNVCFDNIAIDLPGDPEPPHSDGNGIIIDDLKNSQTGHPAGSYPFATLVENNVAFRNGGRGVHVYLSDNVRILNNTSYHNNRDQLNRGTWRGELSNIAASNTIWANNIAVADPKINPRNTAINEGSTEKLQSRNVAWHNNLTFDGRVGRDSLDLQRRNHTLSSRHSYRNLLGVDPQFAGDAGVKAAADLRLRPQSPAVDAGTLMFGASSLDLDGQPRVQGDAIDLGAFECAAKGSS
jgi:parallel beta-helix repeat protein